MIYLNPGDNLTLQVPEVFDYAKKPTPFIFKIDDFGSTKRGSIFYDAPAKKQLRVMFQRITKLCGSMTPDDQLKSYLAFKPDGTWWHHREYFEMQLRTDYRHSVPVRSNGDIVMSGDLVWAPRAIFTMSHSVAAMLSLAYGYQSGKYYDSADQEVES